MEGLWGWTTFWIRFHLSSRCRWCFAALWNCWWQYSGWIDHWFWIITFPNYFGLTSYVFSRPRWDVSGNRLIVMMVVMMMVVVMVWCWEPFGNDDWFPYFLPRRKPYLLPVWHPDLLDVFLPSQLLIGNEFKLFAGLPVLSPSLNPSEFLVRNPDLLLLGAPDLLPRLLPSELLIVNPYLLLRRNPYLLEIFNPS